MKKGRTGFRLEALAPPELADAVTASLFRHSTTAGVRRWSAERVTFARREGTVRLGPRVEVRVQVLEPPEGSGGPGRLPPAYADGLAGAETFGQPPPRASRTDH